MTNTAAQSTSTKIAEIICIAEWKSFCMSYKDPRVYQGAQETGRRRAKEISDIISNIETILQVSIEPAYPYATNKHERRRILQKIYHMDPRFAQHDYIKSLSILITKCLEATNDSGNTRLSIDKLCVELSRLRYIANTFLKHTTTKRMPGLMLNRNVY